MNKKFDLIVIGGGFFGTSVAISKSKEGLKVLLLDSEKRLLSRASYSNQARIHGGYHYPRSILTALRSRVNFAEFTRNYPESVEKNFRQYYAVARNLSKITSHQFETFCQRIGASLNQAKPEIQDLFDKKYIENVFEVEEFAFNIVKLSDRVLTELDKLAKVKTETFVELVRKKGELIEVVSEKEAFSAKYVYNCTYSGINGINLRSGLPTIPLKHELAEMCLIELPKNLQGIGVTVMCGPFFSFMPFPALDNLYSFSHVRYTPHMTWYDSEKEKIINGYKYLENELPSSAFNYMQTDAQRYLPSLKDLKYVKSIWEVKTVLPHSEGDDSRPILFRKFKELPGYLVIMGGKIDNVFDALQESYV